MCIRDRIMGGEERRELIYEGFVNYRLNQGDSEAEAKAYADGQIAVSYTHLDVYKRQCLGCAVAVPRNGDSAKVPSLWEFSVPWCWRLRMRSALSLSE